MNFIVVIDLFHTSPDETAILEFPDGEYPRIGMILKRSDGASWKIIGISMPKYSTETNAYKHLDPPRGLFDCKVEAQSTGIKLEIGNKLYK